MLAIQLGRRVLPLTSIPLIAGALRLRRAGVFWLGLGVLVFSAPPLFAQRELPRGASVQVLEPSILTGNVIGEDGLPVSGAVVVTSAGGQTVTLEDGSFEVEYTLRHGTTAIHVTAVTNGSSGARSGSLRVDDLAPGATREGGTITLSLSSCQPQWLPAFGGMPGVHSSVSALATFDDGSGPALYVGGSIVDAGGVKTPQIAKWDGSAWSSLGSGVAEPGSSVNALAVYDDGMGPALYVGGRFSTAGGVAAGRIAKWDGSSWSAVGGDLGTSSNGIVIALAVYDEGGGPALYAAGGFPTAAGTPVNNIARWNGATWSGVGTGVNGLNNVVRALSIHDDGSGSALYAGGFFTTADGVSANRIARWNGTAWASLGSGMSNNVWALAVHDDGSGPKLYAGGSFTTAGAVSANRIARWDGAAWSALGSGMDADVVALATYDDGGGEALYAGGNFTIAGGGSATRLARWSASAWSPVSGLGGNNIGVTCLLVHDDGTGAKIYVGGFFLGAGSTGARSIAAWDGTDWSELSAGTPGFNAAVRALAVFDDGSGSALYAGGEFTHVGGIAISRIARWDGTSWSPVGSGMNDVVSALAVHDDGGGPALYAGGLFTLAGGIGANRIAKWNGTAWSPLGSGFGIGASVAAITVYDDGLGPKLYAAGTFGTAGGVGANHIARWNGTAWSALGTGLNPPATASVSALAVFNDGPGLKLYVGGSFTNAGGVSASRVARWNGSAWSSVGGGANGQVNSLCVYDNGAGAALYASGQFTSPGNCIAKWNGTAWSTLGTGLLPIANVFSLAVHDDGSGPALYAGGGFSSAGGVSASHIARWNGSAWSALGNGIIGNAISSMAVFDATGCPGAALFVGTFAGGPIDTGDSYLGKWGCSALPVLRCPGPTTLDADVDCQASIPDLTASASVTSACPVTVSQSPLAGTIVGLGPHTVTITATNAAGSASCPASVLVQDATGPVIASCAPPQSLPADGNCNALLPDLTGLVSASDCTGVTVTQSPVAGTSLGLGPTMVMFTVTDGAMNASPCSAQVDVVSPDSDGDGTVDCLDDCPDDPDKIAEGVCGCGVADTDSDGDGTPNCNDGCPNDPDKIAEGLCGCGVADTDSDGDGTPNCNDGCPNDPDKIAEGLCGCGVADTDSDGDGTPNCNDGCPSDPNKVAEGQCGCGVADTDSDGDGTANCIDGCPSDPNKIAEGACGCGVPDTDTDGDGTPNCNDDCPDDPNKVDPGLCGCGTPDTDTDGDQRPDCNDPMTPFCFPGQGVVMPCPCGNPPVPPGLGCNNFGAGPAMSGKLDARGRASLGADTVQLQATGENNTSFTVFWQGLTGQPAAGAKSGAGVRCVSVNLKRLYLANAVGGAISRPIGTQARVSARSAALGDPLAAGNTRRYYCVYRDPNAAGPCGNTSDTLNTTNAGAITWQP